MKRSWQDFGDGRNDAHQVAYLKRTIAPTQRADADPVVIGSVLGPCSSRMCITLAKHVGEVQTECRVVVVIELLGHKRRELLRMPDVLPDSAALDGRHVGPRASAMYLPVLSVVVAAPQLPCPLQRLLLTRADLDLEGRQRLFAREVRERGPAEARSQLSQPLLIGCPREPVAAPAGSDETTWIDGDLRYLLGDPGHVQGTRSAPASRERFEARCRQEDRLASRDIRPAGMIGGQGRVKGWLSASERMAGNGSMPSDAPPRRNGHQRMSRCRPCTRHAPAIT